MNLNTHTSNTLATGRAAAASSTAAPVGFVLSRCDKPVRRTARAHITSDTRASADALRDIYDAEGFDSLSLIFSMEEEA